MGDVLADLRSLPRDGYLLTTEPDAAALAERYGYRALLLGRDWHDGTDLRDRFSALSRRVPACVAFGPPSLAAQAERMCAVVGVNSTTGARRSRRWVEHLLRNLPLLAEHPPPLRRDALRGWPAFVVGAGPSLDAAAPVLPRMRARGVVLRVNAASLAVPGQVTVCAESNDLRHKLDPGDAMRVFALTAPPEVMAHGAGPLRPIWVGESAHVLEELTGIPRVPISGSSLTAAVALAGLWGCDPIVLVGADHAYPAGRVYARSTGLDDAITTDGRYRWGAASTAAPRPSNALPEADELESVRAWGGQGEVLSTPGQRHVRHWLSAAADSIDARTLNASVGGAHIPGWTDVDPARVVEGLGLRHSADLADMVSCYTYPVPWVRGAVYRAADMLADTWALPDVAELAEERRASGPNRWPWLEARATRQHRRQALALRELGREATRAIADEVMRGA